MNYIFFIVGLIAGLILLFLGFFGYRIYSLIIPFISFGPSGRRIPYGLLKEWGLVKGKKYRIRVRKNEIIVFSIFVISFGFLNLPQAGFVNTFFQDFIKFITISTALAGFAKYFLGMDVAIVKIKDPDEETIDKVINYCNQYNIKIKSFSDLKSNLSKFIHLLPVIDIENEKTIFIDIPESEFITLSPEEINSLNEISMRGLVNTLMNKSISANNSTNRSKIKPKKKYKKRK